MTPAQMIGWSLNQTTAISAIVSTRINNGARPTGQVVPCINYFEVAGGWRRVGFEGTTYSINCRASTEVAAQSLARLVVDLFHGTSSTGVCGAQNGFEVTRASLKNKQGSIFEDTYGIYNCPVDIFVVYPTSSVS